MQNPSPNQVSSATHSAPSAEHRRTEARATRLLDDVFAHFPSGIVVVDPAHRVVASNQAAEELVTRAPDAEGPATCCELFGCGEPGTPLEGACLTEIVIASHERLADIYLELPSSPAGQVWVTAAPLYEDGSRIIFQVRPASVEDKPSSFDDLWPERTRIKVHALGRLHLTTWSGGMNGEWLGQRSGQLFKFLITERHHFVPLEKIAESVWPNANNKTGNTVRHCMHILRTNIEPDAARRGKSPFILAKNGGYKLNPDYVSVDADDFERILSDGMRAFADGDSATAINRFETGVAMYRGDFLADEPYAEWAFQERERLRDLVTIPLRALVELRSDDPEVSMGYLQRLADMEPLDGEIQRQLMISLVREGRRSRAVRHYHAFETRLWRAFNERPSFALSDIVSGAPESSV